MKFMMMDKAGPHFQDGRTYFPGDVIETDKRLDLLFINKFMPVADDTPVDCPVYPSFVVSEDGYFPSEEGLTVDPPARVYLQFTHPADAEKRPHVAIETFDPDFQVWKPAVDVAKSPQVIEHFIELTEQTRVRLRVTEVTEPVRMNFKPRFVW